MTESVLEQSYMAGSCVTFYWNYWKGGGGGFREVNTPHNPSKGERCKGGGGAAVNKATVTCKTSVGI